MRKIFLSFVICMFTINFALAGADGDNSLSKRDGEVKDCFERVNRATFAFNQGLDKTIFKPLAKGYRKLPNPIKKGTSNVRLTKKELSMRIKKWKPKKINFGNGTLWKYAQTVGPAYLGAPTHPGAKNEVKVYADI